MLHIYKLIHIASIFLALLLNNKCVIIYFFRLRFFKKEKKMACDILIFFSTEL